MRKSLVLAAVAGLSVGMASVSLGQAAQPSQDGVLTGRVPDGVVNTLPPANPDAPRLVFDKAHHEFGRISDEKAVEVEFTFTNAGKSTLKLQQPKASCGCTVPQMSKLEYAPGEKGSIKVTFNPQGKHGDQNQRVTVASNDGTQPETTLTIHAFVKQTVWFEPPLISFGEVSAGKPVTQQIKVNGPAPDFKVTYVSNTRGRFYDIKVLDTKEVEVDGEKVNQSTLEVTFNGKAPRGPLQAMGVARTTAASHSLADFQILAEVVGDLQTLPPRLTTGLVDPGAEFSRSFRVSSRTNAAFKITSIEQTSTIGSPLVVTATPVEGSNGSAYTVEVKGKAPTTPSAMSGTVTLLTDSATDPKIEVVLSGAVRTPQQTAPPVPADLKQQISPALNAPQSGPQALPAEPAKPAAPAPAGEPAKPRAQWYDWSNSSGTGC